MTYSIRHYAYKLLWLNSKDTAPLLTIKYVMLNDMLSSASTSSYQPAAVFLGVLLRSRCPLLVRPSYT